MFIESVPNRSSPPAILLRESYRDENGVTRKRTLANVAFNHEDWFYKYVVAKARYQLGENRSKFGNLVPASGD